MPYIEYDRRLPVLENYFDSSYVESLGDLTFILVDACLSYKFTLERGDESFDFRYEDYASVIGALECAKQELYRRLVAPYEDKKIKENGDVI